LLVHNFLSPIAGSHHHLIEKLEYEKLKKNSKQKQLTH